MSDTKYTITFDRKKYALDLDAINKFCFKDNKDALKERELTESYEWDDEIDDMHIVNRITRDVNGSDSQDNMIIYDLVKLFIVRLLDNASITKEFEMDFSTSLAINTLIKYGMMVEIK